MKKSVGYIGETPKDWKDAEKMPVKKDVVAKMKEMMDKAEKMPKMVKAQNAPVTRLSDSKWVKTDSGKMLNRKK